MEHADEYVLTDDEKGMLQPLIKASEDLQAETQAVLRAVIRLRKLEGNWTLVGDKLVRPARNGNQGG
jgi:hypothetical protein